MFREKGGVIWRASAWVKGVEEGAGEEEKEVKEISLEQLLVGWHIGLLFQSCLGLHDAHD